MKLISWNVNGLRAIAGKGFDKIYRDFAADIFCIQETKMQEGQLELAFEGCEIFYNCAERKGYSGTSVITAIRPLNVTRGIGVEEHDREGRVLTLEFEEFFLVNVYVPNSQSELARLSYRMQWEDAFLDYIKGLDARKPVIVCGDMNVAHNEIDLANPKSNRQNPGFSDEERACMTRLLSSGFSDTYRKLHPDATGVYSWWSYRGRAREKNVGWRIDYFIVSDRLMPKVTSAEIHPDILGSDHCPVAIEIEL